MPDPIVDQLRRYGDRLEDVLVARDVVTVGHGRRATRWSRSAVAVAAASVVLVVGAAAVLLRDEAPETTVATERGPQPSAPAPPAPTALAGTATWEGRDARAELRVAACPDDDLAVACPTMRTTSVADDGSFTLALPPDAPSARRWRVVAYVQAGVGSCVFNCEFPRAPRNAVTGPAVTVTSAATGRAPLRLTVAARVVDVAVRDRNGDVFSGGGVQATDARCDGSSCPNDVVPMFVQASTDGSVRLTLDPSASYEIHGQATNTGWPDPAWTNDGSTFWFSPSVLVSGDELADGHVFLVDGAPAGPTGP